jgi:hypothetical protein
MHPSQSSTSRPEYKFLLDIINQVFEIEKKVASLPAGTTSIQRNVNRLKTLLEHEVPSSSQYGQPTSAGFTYHNPLGEKYDETRTDCEAAGIAGSSAEDLIITEVIKPIIWYSATGQPKIIVQKAVVVAEARPTDTAPTDSAATSPSPESAQ